MNRDELWKEVFDTLDKIEHNHEECKRLHEESQQKLTEVNSLLKSLENEK